MSNEATNIEKRNSSAPRLRFKEFNENWLKFKLEEVATITTGNTPSTTVDEYYGGEYLFVSPADISSTRFVSDTKTKLTLRGFQQGRKIPKGSVMFVCIGSTIGKVGQAGEDCVTNQQINSLETNRGNSNDFVYSLLEKNGGEIKLLAGTQAVPLINKSSFSNLKFYFPSLPEQQKIASFLIAVDEKIQHLTHKKELLELYKKGVMQQLFSGKLRFKDENGKPYPKWETKRLDDVCEINPSTGELPESFVYIDLESVVKGQLTQERRISKSEAPSRAQRKLQPRDILYQTVRPYQMNNYFFDKRGDYVASTGYAQIRTNETTEYIYQIIHSEKFVNEAIEKCTGTSFPSISSKDLGSIRIPIPNKSEQVRIANFLSILDIKVETLASLIAHTSIYKKGLLQQMFV